MRWMRLRLHAPLAAFGGEAIDSHGVTRDFPAQSMLTGMLANALGWTRNMREAHQRLQDRIVFGFLHEVEPLHGRTTDYQTAQLAKSDQAWTTSSTASGRDGGVKSYIGAHRRWRDYRLDLRLSGVLRLHSQETAPTLDDLEHALRCPARPLFIGRKPCLPSTSIFAGWVEAEDAREALRRAAPAGLQEFRALWPESEGTEGANRTLDLTDERNWLTGLHGGSRRVCEGRLQASENAQ